MTDPANPADPKQDIIGRQASALDSISEVANGLLEFLKAQSQATEQAIAMANSVRKRAPSLDDVRTMTAGLPKEDRDEIEKAMTSEHPNEAVRLLKEKVKRDGDRLVSRPVQPLAQEQADALKRLENCILFKNGKTVRDASQQVVAVVNFIESFCAWLDSVVDMLPMEKPDESIDGFGRALRCMGFIKNHLGVLDQEHPVDPTRLMLNEIFSSFQMDQGTSSVIDIVHYAASTMPELADAVMSLTGHEYPEGVSGLSRWQMARKVVKDARMEDQALGHLANKLMDTAAFQTHLFNAMEEVYVRDPENPMAPARVWLDAMSTYDGPLEQGWSAIALTLGASLDKLEAVHQEDKAQSPDEKPVLK